MRKATMQDIANKAGVSKTTVSMVLNKKDSNISSATKDKIFKITQELNYIPNSIARSLSTKKSGTIGIMVPDITNPFFSEIAEALLKMLQIPLNIMLYSATQIMKLKKKKNILNY